MRDHVLPSTVRASACAIRSCEAQPVPPAQAFPVMLTVSQLADRLQISCHWIYDRIHNGTIAVSRDKLPAVSLSRHVRNAGQLPSAMRR